MISPVNTAIISCSFGRSFDSVYPAPHPNSFFVSNNPDIKDHCYRNGWKFLLCTSHPLVSSYRISSMQAKYVKFLQFFTEFHELSHYDHLVYSDHKFFIKQDHIKYILDTHKRDKRILIRNTPRLKTTLQDEIDDAIKQDRYSKSMPQTLEWISQIKKERSIKEEVRIMNTGIISYYRYDQVLELLAETYETVWKLAQPECQIIWACLSQEYSHHIQSIEWSDLDPQWRLPSK